MSSATRQCGGDRVNLVLAILRARQIWGGTASLPGLREALGLDEANATRTAADTAEEQARVLVEAMEAADWDPDAAVKVADGHPQAVADILGFAAREVVPRLASTTDEIDHALHALSGGFVPAGPSGSPLRGLVNVLPTGRNFYSVDPKAIPSRLAWETGRLLADSLLERYRTDNGEWPTSVGLSLWGTSAMRTSGDDVAEALALLGVRPVWDDASRRVTGLEPVPLDELGRPRIDVTLRISGFFRDAFPHTIGLLDDAVRLAASLDEPDERNFVRAHTRADLAEHGDERRATTRIFGSRPGTYGAGILQLIDSRDWRTDADLAEVYTVWGGYAYGRELDGRPARAEMETAYKRITVAAKNTDTREHDIADSDDYFQYHGGMVATVRALRGSAPRRTSATPPAPRPSVPARSSRRPHGSSARGWSTPAGSRRCAYTVTRSLRTRRHRRLPLRVRRHHRCRRRLDVRQAHRDVRTRPGEPRLPPAGQPLGPARDRGTAP